MRGKALILAKPSSGKTGAECVRLRLEGHSIVYIASKLRVARTTVNYHLRTRMEYMPQVVGDMIGELKALDLSRIDLLMQTWLPLATDKNSPNPTAAAIVLKIMERRARYLGLDDQPELKIEMDNRVINVTAESLAELAGRVLEHQG